MTTLVIRLTTFEIDINSRQKVQKADFNKESNEHHRHPLSLSMQMGNLNISAAQAWFLLTRGNSIDLAC